MNLVKGVFTMYLLYNQRSHAVNVSENNPLMKDPLGTTVCAKWEDIQQAINEKNYQIELEDVDQICDSREKLK